MASDQKLTEQMSEAQGTFIPCAVGSENLASEIATYLGVDTPVNGFDGALQMARDLKNLRADSAFQTRFCDVSDYKELDFVSAFQYIDAHYDGFLFPEQVEQVAVAVAAEGLGGMDGEKAVIEHFGWLRNADGEENDRIDARTTIENAAVQMKRNSRDRNRKRHGEGGWNLPANIVLCSWETCEGGIRVGFEDFTESVMSYGIADGDSPQ